MDLAKLDLGVPKTWVAKDIRKLLQHHRATGHRLPDAERLLQGLIAMRNIDPGFQYDVMITDSRPFG